MHRVMDVVRGRVFLGHSIKTLGHCACPANSQFWGVKQKPPHTTPSTGTHTYTSIRNGQSLTRTVKGCVTLIKSNFAHGSNHQ